MAGPRPDDAYSSVPEVAPETRMPNDTTSVRANPESAGAAIGQGLESLGKGASSAGNDVLQSNLAWQGIANEHAATMAELDLANRGGDIYNEYKNKQGLDASNSRQAYIQKYLELNNQIGSNLNPAAKRAYDQMANRRLSFAIQDMNGYAATQQKQAYKSGNSAMIKHHQDTAGTIEVASNPRRLGEEEQGMVFRMNQAFTDPGFGDYATVPHTVDAKTGELVFEDTHDGKLAQAEYDQALDKEKNTFFTNATMIQATNPDPHNPGSPTKAVDFLLKYKDVMPTSTYRELAGKLNGSFVSEQVRVGAEKTGTDWEQKYLSSQSTPSSGGHPNIYNALLGQESGNKSDVKTSVDGAVGPGQIKPETFARFAKPGEVITNADDNRKVSERYVDYLSSLPNVQGDPARIAVGYFSGEKNISPLGAATPYIRDTHDGNGKFVSSYTSDIEGRMKDSPGVTQEVTGGYHISKADYYRMNEPDMVQQTRDDLKSRGYDTTVQNEGERETRAWVARHVQDQASRAKGLYDQLAQAIYDPKAPITNAQTISNNPDLNQKMIELWGLDSFKAEALQKAMINQATNHSHTYGTSFAEKAVDVLSGKTTRMEDLQDFFGSGDKSPLSPLGIQTLSKIMEGMQTPEGQGFAHAEANFLNFARGKITGTSIFPGANPAVLGPKYDKYLLNVIPQIQAQRAAMMKAGKDPSQMFNLDSPDFIGKGIVGPDKGEITKIATSSAFYNPSAPQAQQQTNLNTSPAAQAPSTVQGSYKTVDDVGLAYAQGKLNKDQARQIVHDQFGGFAPKVPGPEKDLPKSTSLRQALDTPVKDEEDLKKQFADFMVKDYDYGRMKETNPLAYLGYQAVKNQGVASYYKTPTTALGITWTDNEADKDFVNRRDFTLLHKILGQAGLDNTNMKGHIILGPEFGEGKNTNTLEHELMHRGFMELVKRNPKLAQELDDESMIRSYQEVHGYDKHSHELQAGMTEGFKRLPKDLLEELRRVKSEAGDRMQVEAKKVLGIK